MFGTMSFSEYFRRGIVVILLSGQLKIICSPNPLESGELDGVTVCAIYAVQKRVDCQARKLASVPGDLPTDVRNLDLSMNEIHSLWHLSFSRYTQLTRLYLVGNVITWIEHTTFQTLVNLRYLNLDFNANFTITDDLFASNKGLQSLNVDGCQLTAFPGRALQELQELKELCLSFNSFTVVNFTTCKMDSGGTIDLSGNLIQTLDPTTINLNCKVEKLSLNENPIERIDPETIGTFPVRILSFGGSGLSTSTWRNFLKGVSKSRIQLLELYISDLPDFPSDFFDPLEEHYLDELRLMEIDFLLYPQIFKKLTKINTLTLNIKKNKIEILKPEYFTNMIGLRILRFDENSLREINPSRISWNIHLEELYLTVNKISAINNFSFYGLSYLTVLNLSRNPLVSIEMDFSSGLDNLRILDLSGSRLIFFQLQGLTLEFLTLKGSDLHVLQPGETFKWVSSLTVLDIDNSSVVLYDIWEANNNTLFQGLHELKNLSLRMNSFPMLPPGVFKGLRSLAKLDLRECDIWNIKLGAFAEMKSLQTLFLQGNKIKGLNNLLLSDLPLLMRLHVDDNQLNYIDRDFLVNTKHMTNLTILTLANNSLVGFNRSTFNPVRSSLVSIDLSGNPLVCDCKMKWLVFWLHDPTLIKNENETICSSVEATLEPLRGQPLMTFNPNKLCDQNATIYIALTLSGLASMITCVFLYRNRWLVRYKLFLIKLAVLGYKEIHDARDPNDFQFDLNVIFTGDCDDWVQQRLGPFLAEWCPHLNRQVMGDDDLPLGIHVLDAVLYTVENSFKTLLLLKPSSVIDDWFITKFRIAMEHVNDAQRENVVLVFLDDIPYDQLPFLVRLFLSDHGSYLYWTNDITGQRYFWKELEKYLTVNRKTDHRIPPE